MRTLPRLAAAISWIVMAGCGLGEPTIDLRMMNVSDDAVDLAGVDAPEFAYRPPVSVMSGRGSSARSQSVVRSAPKAVVVEVNGRPSETVSVPPLPPNLEGRVALIIVYTRTRRWVAHWQVSPVWNGSLPYPKDRLIPDENDPQFRLHVALLDAAEAGDVRAVDDLLQKGAPLRWDTTWSNPLSTAARWHKQEVAERLLRPGEPAFTPFEIEDAVIAAADPIDSDLTTLRLFISRFGAGLGPAARAQVLNKARETHTLHKGRMVPAGPAIRFLIDDAKFDVNTPIWASGETLLDLASSGNELDHDRALIEFLKARGGRSGRDKQ